MTAPLLKTAELADYLGWKPATVRLHASRGDIPGKKLGRQWRFNLAAVEAEQAARTSDPWAAPSRGRKWAS